ncbi:MAG: malto-oligosyltrehalose trehalohydrolase [Spirochaetia bacterium]
MKSSYKQNLPFGADLKDDGADFRIWAPNAETVDLVLYSDKDKEAGRYPMDSEGAGIFHLFNGEEGAGNLYAFCIDSEHVVPDPYSRYQPYDCHGPSMVIDPEAYVWKGPPWNGRLWEEAVIYELHLGTFSPEGTFRGAAKRLDELAKMGITAVQLMPIADFPGKRNWGYDGVLLFAPDSMYGTPEDIKTFISAAHTRGIMVLLDVVYNHFGPEGNYLFTYAGDKFFHNNEYTQWGQAINYSHPRVREFYAENALYWLNEYRFDGLRLDAVHAINDESATHILTEIAGKVRRSSGANRHIHLLLENDDNQVSRLIDQAGFTGYTAQWNDDFHHCLHTLATKEEEGYYADYTKDTGIASPLWLLGRCLTQGFAYQQDRSPFRHGKIRGEISSGTDLKRFVNFMQNHDQVGNRAFGERMASLVSPELYKLCAVTYLLAPSVPMLFMGEEWGAQTPFLFFCDFSPELMDRVSEGRRKEFQAFPEFRNGEKRRKIPDPGSEDTYKSSCLDWNERFNEQATGLVEWYSFALRIRKKKLVPQMGKIEFRRASWDVFHETCITAVWPCTDSTKIVFIANFGDVEKEIPPECCPSLGEVWFETDQELVSKVKEEKKLPAYFGAWFFG